MNNGRDRSASMPGFNIVSLQDSYAEMHGDGEERVHPLRRGGSVISLMAHDSRQAEELNRPDFSHTNSRLHQLMSRYLPSDKDSLLTSIGQHMEYSLAVNRFTVDNGHVYLAAALTLRDRVLGVWNDSQLCITELNPKRAYYLSIEYLLGRTFQNALLNTDLEKPVREALKEIGISLEELYEEEADAGLGNGGLGRLAACFLDSLSTLNYPAWGYGIRYTFGIFRQRIVEGNQLEVPDYWLSKKNPWEIERNDVRFPVMFYGRVRKTVEDGRERSVWEGGDTLLAQAYDNPVPGFDTNNSINLRLWRSIPDEELNFKKFDEGDYYGSLVRKANAEIVTSVLYPNDSTYAGKELRLKQQYFFVSATLQDILRRYKKKNPELTRLPEKVAIQLNDTHPSLSIVELLRMLVDEEGMALPAAWDVVTQVFSYTNHTVLPEALERWPVDLLGTLLPRHLELIYHLNFLWLEKMKRHFPGDTARIQRMSLIEESEPKHVRMAILSIIGSHRVNGVARLHTQIIVESLFKDFADLEPEKFLNITNGVTPRRWINAANPRLAQLYSDELGTDDWVRNVELLGQLRVRADDPELQAKFAAVKRTNKLRLAKYIYKHLNVRVNENSLFDVLIKRIHEYKRQFMYCLYVLYRYLWLKGLNPAQRAQSVKRTFVLAGKAAPAYFIAKRVIRFAEAISALVNNDAETCKFLQLVFIPNYSVSVAEVVIPASDISEHISTAGTEASGTSNMKFVFNGGLIVGTLDGANIEIADEIGRENMFIFGATVEEVPAKRERMAAVDFEQYCPPELREVFAAVRGGLLGDPREFDALLDSIAQRNDRYLVAEDFSDYRRTQERIDDAFRDQVSWVRKSLHAALSMAHFSSDRSIREYAEKIWHIAPLVMAPARSA